MLRRAKGLNVRDICKGGRELYEKAVDSCYEDVYRFLLYLSKNPAAAEDLTQETFASAWANIDSYKGRASFDTWLHRIAYNKFVDLRRKDKCQTELVNGLQQGIEKAKKQLDPPDWLSSDEEAKILYEGICKLGQAEYLVIVLHYIQGLTFRQMGAVLDESVGTIKWRTNKALKEIKIYLDNRCNHE